MTFRSGVSVEEDDASDGKDVEEGEEEEHDECNSLDGDGCRDEFNEWMDRWMDRWMGGKIDEQIRG